MLINDHRLNYLPEVFTTEELHKLLSYLKRSRDRVSRKTYGEWAQFRNYTIVMTMYELALRPSECLRIRVNELRLDRKKVMINSKNNHVHRGRIMYISEGLRKLLFTYLAHPTTKKYMKDGYIFPTCEGAFMTIDVWKEEFQAILKGAEIYEEPMRRTHGHFSSYTLRHTRATFLFIQTRDLRFVANFLGHTTYSSTFVYIHLADLLCGYESYMRKAVEKLNSAQHLYA